MKVDTKPTLVGRTKIMLPQFFQGSQAVFAEEIYFILFYFILFLLRTRLVLSADKTDQNPIMLCATSLSGHHTTTPNPKLGMPSSLD